MQRMKNTIQKSLTGCRIQCNRTSRIYLSGKASDVGRSVHFPQLADPAGSFRIAPDLTADHPSNVASGITGRIVFTDSGGFYNSSGLISCHIRLLDDRYECLQC